MPKRATPLAWNPQDGSARDARSRARPPERSRKLTRQAIVHAAVRLADSDGLHAVTIRRLAAELDVKPMSLYVHIATKDDLLALMMDEVVGEMLIDKPLPANWRDALRASAKKAHAAYASHPWVLEAFARGSVLGPNALQQARQEARALAGMGLPAQDVWMIVATVGDFVIGNAHRVATRGTRRGFEHLLSPGDLAVSPELAALPTASSAPVAKQRFEIGLEALLDGLESRYLASPQETGRTGRARKPRASRTTP